MVINILSIYKVTLKIFLKKKQKTSTFQIGHTQNVISRLSVANSKNIFLPMKT